MKGTSSPIRSPQFLTCRDFLVTMSMEILGEPVTTEDSIESTTSSLACLESVDMFNAAMMLLEPSIGTDLLFPSTPTVSMDANVVVGVVWRRVKRILFVGDAVVIFPLASIVSQADTDGRKSEATKTRKEKLINSPYDDKKLMFDERAFGREVNIALRSLEWDASECVNQYLSSHNAQFGTGDNLIRNLNAFTISLTKQVKASAENQQQNQYR